MAVSVSWLRAVKVFLSEQCYREQCVSKHSCPEPSGGEQSDSAYSESEYVTAIRAPQFLECSHRTHL